MVGVAQLVERWLVEPDVAGSSPVVHPIRNGLASVGPLPIRSWKAGIVQQTAEHTGTSLQREVGIAIDSPWTTTVWNDPVNLMSYVSWVFRSYFGFSHSEAERRMRQVHEEGHAVVAAGSREEMERYVEALHDFGLWATLQKADA